MRTLFIHPTDPSTEFLNSVYADYVGNDDVTIIEGTRISHAVIKRALKDADRIIFMGHGTEYGLLDMIGNRYVITSKDLQFFKNKPVICYWCNANIFVDKYDLNAFATGMFVSEIKEANWFNLPMDQNLIDASNNLFCKILSRCLFDDVNTIMSVIDRAYIDNNNPIICFNRECMGLEPKSLAQSL